MITREQVADLQAGDVVELRVGAYTIRGPLGGRTPGLLTLHIWRVREDDGGAYSPGDGRTLTVISRAPRPLYVNHDRTEPVPGDVVRYADGSGDCRTWVYKPRAGNRFDWLRLADNLGREDRHELPDRLRLLVDGSTGQAVP